MMWTERAEEMKAWLVAGIVVLVALCALSVGYAIVVGLYRAFTR